MGKESIAGSGEPNDSEEETMKLEWKNGGTEGFGSNSDPTNGKG